MKKEKEISCSGSTQLKGIRESIVKYYLSHPDARHQDISAKFKRNETYLCALLKEREVIARIDYLRQTTFKSDDKSLIWSRERIIRNVQNRLDKTRSDFAYLKGHEMLARWNGMDKQTISHEINDFVDNIRLVLSSRVDEIPIPEKSDEIQEQKNE